MAESRWKVVGTVDPFSTDQDVTSPARQFTAELVFPELMLLATLPCQPFEMLAPQTHFLRAHDPDIRPLAPSWLIEDAISDFNQ